MDINKVNEIVADIEAEDLAEQKRQEAMADEFLKDRLEYYVAQVIAGKIINTEELFDVVIADFSPHFNFNHFGVVSVVTNIIDNKLRDLGWENLKSSYGFGGIYTNTGIVGNAESEQPKPSNAHWFLFAIIVSNFIGVLIGVCIK